MRLRGSEGARARGREGERGRKGEIPVAQPHPALPPRINEGRDLMTQRQLAADMAKRALNKAEERTEAELNRLQAENAHHLGRLAAYEEQKRVVAEATGASGEGASSSTQVRSCRYNLTLRRNAMLLCQSSPPDALPLHLSHACHHACLPTRRSVRGRAKRRVCGWRCSCSKPSTRWCPTLSTAP